MRGTTDNVITGQRRLQESRPRRRLPPRQHVLARRRALVVADGRPLRDGQLQRRRPAAVRPDRQRPAPL